MQQWKQGGLVQLSAVVLFAVLACPSAAQHEVKSAGFQEPESLVRALYEMVM